MNEYDKALWSQPMAPWASAAAYRQGETFSLTPHAYTCIHTHTHIGAIIFKVKNLFIILWPVRKLVIYLSV